MRIPTIRSSASVERSPIGHGRALRSSRSSSPVATPARTIRRRTAVINRSWLMFADLLTAGYEPHDVKRLYIHGTDKVNTWVDITETLDLKIKALQQHVSQINPEEVGKWMQEWAEEEAKGQEMKFAEAYKVMILKKEEEQEEQEEEKVGT